ncbi:MAG: hypothetical protein AAFS10_15820 [Myxococcota bacterium]
MKKLDEERVMASDPFEEEGDVLAHTFYQPGHVTNSNDSGGRRAAPKPKPKPTHYKTVSISLYLDDIERIDNLVRELKRRGFTKMNRSALIRFAIDTVNIDDLPPQY